MSDSVPKPPVPNPEPSGIPAKIGRYEILGKLGSGSTGTVYRATDPLIGRILAIKTFRVDLSPGPQRDRFLQRFYHEARISGGLSHPNIVALYDVGEVDGLPYLVLEHVEGPTLDVALARSGRLDSAETIRVVEQAADALDFAHARGIVHRDIRPANIILAGDKRVRIADFGIARIEGSQLTQHGEILGTPAYMSPEQIRGQELSASSDLFSLGVCAYEMLSGHRPFEGKTQAELLEALVYSPPTEPKELRTLGIPSREFMFVFERALAKDPAHRFADGASFARALKSCLGVPVPGEEPLPVARIAIPDPPPNLRRAILPPVAPPPMPPYRFDSGATVAAEGGRGVKGVSSTEATAVWNTGPEPASSGSPDDPAGEPYLPVTIGFDQRLTAKKSDAAADATMVTPDIDFDLPPTARMSRQAVESLLAKSSSARGAASSPDVSLNSALKKNPPDAERATSRSRSALEDLLPPTREMARLPSKASAGAAQAGAPDTVVGPQDPSGTVSNPGTLQRPADKTMIMTESEKAGAAKIKDHSVRQLPFRSVTPKPAPKPAAPPPLPPTRPGIPRPPATASAVRPPTQPVPRPFLAPKILLGGVAFLSVLALALGVLFARGPGKPGPKAAEMWNDLPVYPEAEVEKSPLLLSHDMPAPKLEPGRVVSVTVSWIVTPEGVVDDPRIVGSASPEIDAFFLEGLRKWRYEPGQKGGKTVPVRVLRKYTFGQRGKSEGP